MSLAVTKTIAETRRVLAYHRFACHSIGFVPSMGALHAGHRRLIESARAQSDFLVVSIFVNPLQFDRADDYERYARQIPEDLSLCESAGADLVFAPPVEEIYPETLRSFVEVEGVSRYFCGASRPGHFRGVATVVAKLFGVVQPEFAFFGEKDAQQLAVIQALVRDLNFPVQIVPVPTVREPDGLAMSSRNARLNAGERAVATCLYQALRTVQQLVEAGKRDVREMIEAALPLLSKPGVRVDYFDLADPATFQPVTEVDRPVRALGAIWVGATRLIDNLLCIPTPSPTNRAASAIDRP